MARIETITEGLRGDQAAQIIRANDIAGTAPDWVAEAYTGPYMAAHGGLLYKLGTGISTTGEEAPGVSPKWVLLGAGTFDKEVQNALGGTPGIQQLRPPALPTAQYFNNNNNVFINTTLITSDGAGKVSKIFYRAQTSGERTFYLVQHNGGTAYTVVSAHNLMVTAGQNELSVNIPYSGRVTVACPGSGAIGIYAADGNEFAPTRYAYVGGVATLNIGQQYNFQVNDQSFGWIDFGFEVEVTGAPSGEEFLKKTWSYVNTPTAGGVTVDRVTIAGQSNAYGTGALSELSNPIFAENEINWQGAFNRVFIWDKFANEYRKLQIGVTNMASWDGRYAHPNGSVSPFPTFGPEIGIAVSWLHGNKSGQLYIHKDLGDGRPISYFQKGGAAYADYMQQYEAGNDWLALRGLAVKSLGFLWVQGESDNGQSQGYYQGQLSTLIESYNEDSIIKPYSNIVLALINPQNGGYSAAINAAKVAYAESNPNASTVEYSNNLNPDGVHLNALGNILLGLGAGQTINRVDPLTAEQMYTLPNYTR